MPFSLLCERSARSVLGIVESFSRAMALSLFEVAGNFGTKILPIFFLKMLLS